MCFILNILYPPPPHHHQFCLNPVSTCRVCCHPIITNCEPPRARQEWVCTRAWVGVVRQAGMGSAKYILYWIVCGACWRPFLYRPKQGLDRQNKMDYACVLTEQLCSPGENDFIDKILNRACLEFCSPGGQIKGLDNILDRACLALSSLVRQEKKRGVRQDIGSCAVQGRSVTLKTPKVC